MPTITRRALLSLAAATAAALLLLAAPLTSTPTATAETVSPFDRIEASPVAVAINTEGGESVTINLVLNVAALERGTLRVDSDLGEGRFLLTIESDHAGLRWLDDDRVEWTCDDQCAIAASVRIDSFTDTRGQVSLNATGGVAEGEPPAEAALSISAADAIPGLAKAYELEYSELEYPDTGDQAPHAAADLVEYNLGDPSDEIQLVVRTILGEVSLDNPSDLATPDWAFNLIPIERSGACAPECVGTALVRVGPSDFSNLVYQVLAYSDRPGAAASITTTRTPLTGKTEIGFATLTADQPVVAIPITLSGDVEATRVVADVGVRGRSSFTTLRPVGETAFEPSVQWVAPAAGETQFELAISAPETQLGDVTVSWTVALFTLPGATADIEVGSPAQTQFEEGQAGDPGEFEDLSAPQGDDGGGLPLVWIALIGAVGLGGFGIYRYARR